MSPAESARRFNFEDMTPVFPNRRIRLERPGGSLAMRIVDLVSPIGKGQRGMIVSPPKAGKTTLLKEVALSVQKSEPDMHLLILLIDERYTTNRYLSLLPPHYRHFKTVSRPEDAMHILQDFWRST